MANLFIAIPAPARNGSGAAVDMTAMGAVKTITVVGSGALYEPTITIEISNEVSPTKWAPVATFAGPSLQTVNVACRWMRATVSNYKSGAPSIINVGGGNQGCQFVELVALSGGGAGNEVDTSALGPTKTITVGGPFRGVLNIEVSEDGLTFQTAASFSGPGFLTLVITAKSMRVSRTGVPVIDPGMPLINVGAQAQGVAVALFPVAAMQTVDFTASTGILYQTDSSGGDINVQLPAAAGRNGQWVGFVINSSGFTNAVPAGTDTINGGGVFPMTGSFTILLISDGVSNWIPGI